mgnify:CR=1 FL=1
MKNLMRIIILSTVLITVTVFGQIYAYEYKGIDIRGFVSQGFLMTSDNNFFAQTEKGTTQFNEAAINFSADVSDKLRIGTQFLARDMGTIGNNEIILDWAVADYRLNDKLGLMAGQMKFVHGLYNDTRDVDMLRTFILLPQSVYNEAIRESSGSIQGVGLYGDIPLADMGSLNYDAQYGNINLSNNKGAARLLEDQWPFKNSATETDPLKRSLGMTMDVDNIDVKKTYAGSLKWITNLEGLVFGVSSYSYDFTSKCTTYLDASTVTAVGTTLGSASLAGLGTGLDVFGTSLRVPDSKFDAKAKVYTASVEFTWRNLVLAAEYMKTTYNLSITNELFGSTFSSSIDAKAVLVGGFERSGSKVKFDEFSSEGYYGSLAYRFTPWLEMGTYYSIYYPNKADKKGEDRVLRGLDLEEHRGWLKDICATARFDITENWTFKLEGHKMDGAAILQSEDNPEPDVATDEQYKKNWYLYAAKATFNF